MSKIQEYLNSVVGYDSNGLPATTTQFTFGLSPMMIAENESIENVTEISAVCQTDAVVDLKVVDDIAMVTFDFSLDSQTMVELVEELEMYKMQRQHSDDVLHDIMNQIDIAERNKDEKTQEELTMKLRMLSIPFMMPTLVPAEYGGMVNVGFTEDPKFFFFTADTLNENPYKITMIFDARTLYCQDELGIYMGTTEEEIAAQQEEMWYMEEARKMEEAAFQAQYGMGMDLYSSAYDEDAEYGDKRMKGVRVK